MRAYLGIFLIILVFSVYDIAYSQKYLPIEKGSRNGDSNGYGSGYDFLFISYLLISRYIVAAGVTGLIVGGIAGNWYAGKRFERVLVAERESCVAMYKRYELDVEGQTRNFGSTFENLLDSYNKVKEGMK